MLKRKVVSYIILICKIVGIVPPSVIFRSNKKSQDFVEYDHKEHKLYINKSLLNDFPDFLLTIYSFARFVWRILCFDPSLRTSETITPKQYIELRIVELEIDSSIFAIAMMDCVFEETNYKNWDFARLHEIVLNSQSKKDQYAILKTQINRAKNSEA